jgi:hypothetical protein
MSETARERQGSVARTDGRRRQLDQVRWPVQCLAATRRSSVITVSLYTVATGCTDALPLVNDAQNTTIATADPSSGRRVNVI